MLNMIGTTENIKKYNLTWRDIVPIICANGNIHLFLKPDIEKEIKKEFPLLQHIY